jgi:hypothetical protein
VPESGELNPWTVSEIEEALSKDMNEMARDVAGFSAGTPCITRH